MTVHGRAAIARTVNEPLAIEAVDVRGPGEGEVLVEMKASGLCHTDLSTILGSFPMQLPAILGHEGAGVVLECGTGVTVVEVGDHVILANTPHCGRCRPCLAGRTSFCVEITRARDREPVFRVNGAPMASAGAVASFCTHTVVRDIQIVKIDSDIPFESAALVPCGVMTGVGSVLSGAHVDAGSSVVVFGMGSIGLNVLQGSRLVGATRIVAVDTNPAKEAIARRFGATDFVDPNAAEEPLGKRLQTLIGGPADYAFECVGNVELLAEALALINPIWGVCLAVGIPPSEEQIVIPAKTFQLGRSLMGTLMGNANPLVEIPRILDWYRSGEILLDELITRRLPLDKINDGFDLMVRGESIRSIICY